MKYLEMKSDCFKYFVIHWLCVHSFWMSRINAEFDGDMWMDPDAWTRDHLVTEAFESTNNKCCRCADIQGDHVNTERSMQELKETVAEDSASSIYFKKFVTMLFNRKYFKYNPTKQHYERSIFFVINSHQMDKLEQLQDPRDLDSVLTEIFNNVGTTSTEFDFQEILSIRDILAAIKTILFTILSDMRQLIKTSEMRFFLIVLSVIFIAWLVNKRLKISWLLLVSAGVLMYGYFHTYIECNRELEVNQMMEILNSSTENENNKKSSKVLRFFKELFYSDDLQIQQQQKIKQSAKLSLGFCRPDHVFLMYFNDLFLKYLQVLIEQCTVTISSLNDNLGFPYNLLTPFVAVVLIGYLLKLTFKYILSPSTWSQLLHQKQSFHRNEKILKNTLISEDDRISGDNLKLLLNVINALPQRNTDASALQNSSGVEDIREAIESSSGKSSPKVDENTFEKDQNNTVSNKQQSDEIDVKTKDLAECS